MGGPYESGRLFGTPDEAIGRTGIVPPCLVPPLLVKAGFEPFSARERLGLEKPKVGEPPLRNLPGGTTTSENIGNGRR